MSISSAWTLLINSLGPTLTVILEHKCQQAQLQAPRRCQFQMWFSEHHHPLHFQRNRATLTGGVGCCTAPFFLIITEQPFPHLERGGGKTFLTAAAQLREEAEGHQHLQFCMNHTFNNHKWHFSLLQCTASVLCISEGHWAGCWTFFSSSKRIFSGLFYGIKQVWHKAWHCL